MSRRKSVVKSDMPTVGMRRHIAFGNEHNEPGICGECNKSCESFVCNLGFKHTAICQDCHAVKYPHHDQI